MPEPFFSAQFVSQLSAVLPPKYAGEFLDKIEVLREAIREQEQQAWRLNDQLGHLIGLVEKQQEALEELTYVANTHDRQILHHLTDVRLHS